MNKIIGLNGNRDLGPMEADKGINWTGLRERLH